MRTIALRLLACYLVPSMAAEPIQKNLTWFEAKGSIESHQSSDGKGGQRPKLVLFSHDWDMLSKLLKKELVTKLKSEPENSPILLEANCTDSEASPYYAILKEHDLRTLPVIGIHTKKGWRFINPEAEFEAMKVKGEGGLVTHLVNTITSQTNG